MIRTREIVVRLLAVDDRPENLFAFQRILEGEPYQLDQADSAHEALRLLLRHEYACVLCDVHMPEVSGIELAEIVRADPGICDTPIIFITAEDAPPARVYQAFDSGAYDFITKPVDPVVLRGKLRIFSLLYMKRKEIHRQQQLFQAMIENMTEGIAVVTASGRLVYVNDQLVSMIGRPPGTGFREWFAAREFVEPESERSLGAAELALEQAIAGRRVVDQEVMVRARAGQCARYLTITASPMRDEGNIATHVVLLARDVTERMRQELTIRSKNRELEQFAYVASHDLKAPLRHIGAFTDILAEELAAMPDNPEVAKAMSVIKRGSVEMRQLIDALLRFSRVGNDAMRVTPVALQGLVEEVWGSFVEAELNGAGLEVGELPEIDGDRDRIRQLVQNLLANALKFRSEERPLSILVSAEDCGEHWQIRVRDNGIGIAAKHRDRVFEMFQRLHARSRYEGSGIGLSICKKVIEQHGGTIVFESDGATGTTFVIEWPKTISRRP